MNAPPVDRGLTAGRAPAANCWTELSRKCGIARPVSRSRFREFQSRYEAAVPDLPLAAVEDLVSRKVPWSEMVELIERSAPHGFLTYFRNDVHPVMALAGVPADKAGLAAALISTSQQLGPALGLAIFSAIATSRTHHLLVAHASRADALTSGFQRALVAASIFLVAAAIIALRTTNTRGEAPALGAIPDPAMS
jgi:hypothetical protein